MSVKISVALKSHLGMADAADADVVNAVAAGFMDGTLPREKYEELVREKDADEADDLHKKLDTLLARTTTTADGAKSRVTLASGVGAALADEPEGGTKSTKVRVKRAKEGYAANRMEKFFPDNYSVKSLAGQRFTEGSGIGARPIDEPSQLDKAVAGAWCKLQIAMAQAGTKDAASVIKRMNEHDQDLLLTALEDYEFGGVIGSKGSGCSETSGSIEVKNRKLTEFERKALIDDSTSGGLEAAPIVFDDMIITTPLLFGEFYPKVNVVPITRGRRIEGVSFSIPTIQSGGSDNDNIDLFTTTNFITAFDTTIFVADAAIEIGLDFLSDSPVDVTAVVVDGYSRQLLAWLDEQICQGDGTTEPEGIMVASGTASVAGGSAAPTVGVYESFFFGVAKRFKQGYPNDRIMFGANETTYQRARAIAVGASDARRIFGMTHGDYMLMGHTYGINDNMANTKAFYANMARYRMYRRLGMTIKATTEGQTLVRKNLMMISCRSRWGGHLELGGAAAVSSTMQA